MKNLLPPVEKKKKWRNRKSKGWYKELIYLARKHKAWYENFFQSSRWCSYIFCSSLCTFLFWHLWWVGPEHCSSAIPNPKGQSIVWLWCSRQEWAILACRWGQWYGFSITLSLPISKWSFIAKLHMSFS